MNTMQRISVQEFALFTVESLLEAAEVVIERHETYESGVSAERTDCRGIPLEILAQIRACFYVERFCRLVNTRRANVEYEMNPFLKSFGVDWLQVVGSGEVWRAGPYLYHDWESSK